MSINQEPQMRADVTVCMQVFVCVPVKPVVNFHSGIQPGIDISLSPNHKNISLIASPICDKKQLQLHLTFSTNVSHYIVVAMCCK